MKRLTKLLLIFAVFSVYAAHAQGNNPEYDKVSSGSGYIEKDGKWIRVHDRDTLASWPLVSGEPAEFVQYIYLPSGRTKAVIPVKVKQNTSITLSLRLTDNEGTKLLHEQTYTVNSDTKSSHKNVALFDNVDIPEEGWYRFVWTCEEGHQNLASTGMLQFYKENNTVSAATGKLGSPSVYLNGWGTTDREAPEGASYDWIYQEVMIPEGYAYPYTFVANIQLPGAGYAGIQANNGHHDIIFSMWDNTDKASTVDAGPNVTVDSFGGEGTGAKAILRDSKNGKKFWEEGKWVRFLMNVRTETTATTDESGNKRTMYNTLYSTWYDANDGEGWHYIATHRVPNRTNYFSGWNSFLEDWVADNGQVLRKTYFRNSFMRAMSDGAWYNRNVVSISQTDRNPPGGLRERNDIGGGVTDDKGMEGYFFMTNGGYGKKDIKEMTAELTESNVMDGLDLTPFMTRVDEALRNEQNRILENSIPDMSVKYDQTKWTVTGWSSETANDDGRAAYALDGNEQKGWHSKYDSPAASFPHWITIEADGIKNIDRIEIVQNRPSYYRAQLMDIYISDNGKEWRLAANSIKLDDAARQSIKLAKALNTRHLKLEFTKGYGQTWLYVNEIYFYSAPMLEPLKEKAADILETADTFGGYSSEELKTLKNVYDDGNVTDAEALLDALRDVTSNAEPLKYGIVNDVNSISSFKAYQITNVNNLGTIIHSSSHTKNNVWLGGSHADNIPQDNSSVSEAVAVKPEENNWLVLRSNKYKNFYIYNMAAKKFLAVGNPSTLVDRPVALTVNKVNKTNGFTVINKDGDKLQLCAIPQNAGAPVGNGENGEPGTVWELRDNYNVTPDEKWIVKLLEDIDEKTKIENYVKTEAPSILSTPVGVVGGFAEEHQKETLRNLYNNGNVTDTLSFVAAIEQFKKERIAFNPSVCYKIKNVWTGANDAPYLSIGDDSLMYRRKKDITPSQIWNLIEADVNGKYYFSTQGMYGGTIKNGEKIRMTEEDNAGLYSISEQNGRYACHMIHTGGIGTSIHGRINPIIGYTGNAESSLWYLEPVMQYSVTMSSDGYNTLCLPFEVILPDGLTAYTVRQPAKDATVTLSMLRGNTVAAGTPIILKGEKDMTYNCNIRATYINPEPDNLLSGTFMRKDNLMPGTYYNLETVNGKTVFSISNTDSIPHNKAYLTVEAIESNNTSLQIATEGTSGIEEDVVTDEKDSHKKIYDISGRRISRPSGIYIMNGKKFINK